MKEVSTRSVLKVAGILVAACCLACIGAFSLFLRGCMTQHSRTIGHGNITFDIYPPSNKVVFSAVGRGGRDLYLLDLNTGHVERLTDSEAYETAPSWAPDGRSVVYAAGLPGDRADHIFSLELARREPVQLTFGDTNDTSPSYSPDGSQIVFTRETEYRWGGLASSWNECGSIYRMERNGNNQKLLVASKLGERPRFSSDGKSLVWSEQGKVHLTEIIPKVKSRPFAERGYYATFSPDGKRIAFVVGEYSPDFRICVGGVQGEPREILNFTPEGCFHPRFSSNDTILFLMEFWPNGPTGYPARELWRADLKRKTAAKVAGSTLFDNPLGWTVQ